MDISKIKVKVKNKTPKRLGRGTGSGWGKTAGRGNKGAGSRSGKKQPYTGYRGGNLPLARLFPKRGFHAPAATEYQIVNLRDIQKKLAQTSEVTPEALKTAGLIKDATRKVKILASGKDKFSLKIVCKADKFSSSAQELIERCGGKAECLTR